MRRDPESLRWTPERLLQILKVLYGKDLDAVQIRSLALAITPYLGRTSAPFAEAVRRISANYLRDGARVQSLRTRFHAGEWEAVLKCVVAYANQHTLFPIHACSTGSPDRHASRDIQRALESYNFEAPLDAWLSVIVVRRLRRGRHMTDETG